MRSGWRRASGRLSCSGIALYAALRNGLPADLATHGVVLPSEPAALYASLEARREPRETMAFVDHYRPGEPYPNGRTVLALGLTVPANGREYGVDDPFVRREVERVSDVLGLPEPATAYFGEHEILHPSYFGNAGSIGGALYGRVRPFWMSGPLHRPRYCGSPAAVAVEGRGLRAPGGRYPGGPRGRHDLDRQAAPLSGKVEGSWGRRRGGVHAHEPWRPA